MMTTRAVVALVSEKAADIFVRAVARTLHDDNAVMAVY